MLVNYYNIEGKISQCWVAHEGGFFFYNWGQNYLGLIGCAKVVVFTTMASWFAEVDGNGIQDLMVSSEDN